MSTRFGWAGFLLFFVAGTAAGGSVTAPPLMIRESWPVALPSGPSVLPSAKVPSGAKAVKREPKTCAQLVAALERSVLDLNARGWASVRALPGFGADEVAASPSGSILTESLKGSFESRLAYWAARPAAPLDAQELARLRKVEKKIEDLSKRCAI